MPTALRLAAIASAIAIAVTGCSVGQTATSAPTAPLADTTPLAELTLLANPRNHTGASTAVLVTTAIEPITPAAAPELPVTVVSHDLDGDRDVTITSADRVIALDIAGSISATVAGLGLADHLVGRDESSTFQAVADLPVVTSGAHSINGEAVLALRPDLVITDGTVGPIDVLLQLRDAGIEIVFVDAPPSIDGVSELARQVGAALGAAGAGQLLAARLQGEISEAVGQIAAIAPSAESDKVRMLFLYLRGSSGIYYLFGEESGADVLIESLGGIDVAGEIGWDGMRPMTDEALVAANPDLILVMTDGLASVGGVDALLESKPAIALTRAGQNKRFVDMADGQVLSFGPRTAGVLEALARAIYSPKPVAP